MTVAAGWLRRAPSWMSGGLVLLAVALAEATQFELPVFEFHVHLRSGRETTDLGLL